MLALGLGPGEPLGTDHRAVLLSGTGGGASSGASSSGQGGQPKEELSGGRKGMQGR